MSTPADRAPNASWATEQERSNLWALRAMRWLAMTAGRRASRVVLHPIALYFLLANGTARRHSRHYLSRAFGRSPGRLA